MMRPSLKQHIYKQFLVLNILTVIALVALVELMCDDLEDHMITYEMTTEKSHYINQIGDIAQTWRTANTQATFVPEGTINFLDIPEVFRALPAPYSGRIELADKEYWVDISRLPTGILYIARDTELFEQREAIFILGITLIGALFIIVSFVLTQLTARRIVTPLDKLTQEISSISPRSRAMRVSVDYRDHELHSIATTFNTYLTTMEEYVKREHMLISMASHELRTPIAVISGALDVLTERGTANKSDSKTINRIRNATNQMNANVEAILMLARKQSSSHPTSRILLSEQLQSVVQERLKTHPYDQERLLISPSEINHELVSVPTLINMMLKNLIQNALEHTQGKVRLQQNSHGLLVSDEGAGLPKNVHLQLSQKISLPPGQMNKSGLGLFIVTLICERLGYAIEVDDLRGDGTHLQLRFQT